MRPVPRPGALSHASVSRSKNSALLGSLVTGSCIRRCRNCSRSASRSPTSSTVSSSGLAPVRDSVTSASRAAPSCRVIRRVQRSRSLRPVSTSWKAALACGSARPSSAPAPTAARRSGAAPSRVASAALAASTSPSGDSSAIADLATAKAAR